MGLFQGGGLFQGSGLFQGGGAVVVNPSIYYPRRVAAMVRGHFSVEAAAGGAVPGVAPIVTPNGVRSVDPSGAHVGGSVAHRGSGGEGGLDPDPDAEDPDPDEETDEDGALKKPRRRRKGGGAGAAGPSDGGVSFPAAPTGDLNLSLLTPSIVRIGSREVDNSLTAQIDYDPNDLADGAPAYLLAVIGEITAASQAFATLDTYDWVVGQSGERIYFDAPFQAGFAGDRFRLLTAIVADPGATATTITATAPGVDKQIFFQLYGLYGIDRTTPYGETGGAQTTTPGYTGMSQTTTAGNLVVAAGLVATQTFSLSLLTPDSGWTQFGDDQTEVLRLNVQWTLDAIDHFTFEYAGDDGRDMITEAFEFIAGLG